MHRAGRAAGCEITVEDVELDPASIDEAIVQWQSKGYDAVCAYNDMLGLGLLSPLQHCLGQLVQHPVGAEQLKISASTLAIN